MDIEKIKEFFATDRFAIGIGCNIEEAEPGHSVITLEVEDRHLNGNNVVQGGVMFTLADFAAAVASCADGSLSVSANANISYLSAGSCKRLIAVSDAVKTGRTLSYYESVITDENGKKLAVGTFTMCRVRNEW